MSSRHANHQQARISRRGFLKAAGGVLAGSLFGASGTAYYSLAIEPERVQVEQITITIPRLPQAFEGLRAVQISDLHYKPYVQLDYLERCFGLVNELNPDLILMTGDYVHESAVAINELVPALSGLEASLGVFAVAGNHDYWTDIDVIRAGFQAAGIPFLTNENVQVERDGMQLAICGLDDAWAGTPDLDQAVAGVAAETVRILLAHEPDQAVWWLAYDMIDLQLSGHSHGGQVCLPFIGAPVLPVDARLYSAGLYQVKTGQLYVNRGLGVAPLPIRFNCPPEITEITLTAGR